MTPEIMAWGKAVVTRYNLASKKTLEIGSMDVNGSFRRYFTGEYLGIDQAPGPGVDKLMNAHDLPLEWYRDYDVVVCTEMIEHDPIFWESINEAYSVLRVGGYLLLSTCGFGFGRHDFPIDCYRFSLDALQGLLLWAGFDVIEQVELPGPSVVTVGRKS